MIFNRFKNTQVELIDDNTLKVISTMTDTYHEIIVTLKVNISDSNIIEASAQFLRQPDVMCKETAKFIEKLVGVSLGRGITKNAIALIGGTSGCTHIVDMVLESAKAFVQGKFTKQFNDIGDREKAIGFINKQLEGTCWYHARHQREAAKEQE